MSSHAKWIQVGELANGFAKDANTLEYIEDLVGRSVDIHMENGWVIRHVFENNNTLTWHITAGDGVGSEAVENYTATSLRDNIYFVNFVKANERATSVSLILDFNTGNATAVIGQLPTESETMKPAYQRVNDGEELTPVTTSFVQGAIGRPYNKTDGHPVTDELVGKRIQYQYSPYECYEHVYLNSESYTWQCLKGVEQGLADTDRCHYYKVADQLYLFVWREKSSRLWESS